jgi:hypothetical protein
VTRRGLGRLSAIILALVLTVCAVPAPALAQQADINAIYKAFQENYARGNYPAALNQIQGTRTRRSGRRL